MYETPISGTRDILVKDLQTGGTNLISINRIGTGGGTGSSTSPLLSWDGRFVVFASKASDLVENDANNVSDIFVRDRLLGNTMLVSLNLGGDGSGNSVSSKPVLAADGRTVVFQSFASDLVPGDYNDRRDVFVLRLDGADPASGSVLRLLTLTSAGGGATRVIWSAVPGKRYQAQFKDNIANADWTNLPAVVMANGTTASALDAVAGPGNQRFYRVLLVP